MTTILTIKGADFSANAVGFTPPVTSGLKGWWYIGQNAAQSVKDLAFIEDALAVGVPTYGTGYATFTSLSKYLQTDMVEEAEGTVLCVAKWPDTQVSLATGVAFASLNSISPYDTGVTFHASAGTYPDLTITASFGKNEGGTTIFQQLVANDVSQRAFYAVAWSQTGTSKALYNMTAGTAGTGSFSGTRVVSGEPIRIGSSNNSRTGEIEMSFFAYYNRVLTSDERTDIYTAVQRFLLDKRGLTI